MSFWEKSCFKVFRPKWPQNEIFKLLWKIDTQNFSDVLYQVTVKLKVDLKEFFRNFLGPKWGFSSIIKSHWLEYFGFFAWSYSSRKTLTQKIFWEKTFVLKFLGWKGPKLGPKWGFSDIKIQCMELFLIFCMALPQHKDSNLKKIIFWGKI